MQQFDIRRSITFSFEDRLFVNLNMVFIQHRLGFHTEVDRTL